LLLQGTEQDAVARLGQFVDRYASNIVALKRVKTGEGAAESVRVVFSPHGGKPAATDRTASSAPTGGRASQQGTSGKRGHSGNRKG
jgi:hypothetical protein